MWLISGMNTSNIIERTSQKMFIFYFNKTFQSIVFKLFYVFLFASFLSASATAQQFTLEDHISQRLEQAQDHNYLSLSFENDSIGSGRDENYTNGVRLTYFDVETEMPETVRSMAEKIPTFSVNQTTATFFTLGQNLYTPRKINNPNPQPNDRPWAAWLYGSIGMATIQKNRMDELELTAGIIGPEALGEPIQRFVHKNIPKVLNPVGWDNQLSFEPGIILSWKRRWPAWQSQTFNDNLHMRIEPNINASLGNAYTYAGAGATISLSSKRARFQDTPPRVQPGMAGTGFFDTEDHKFSWQLFAGVDGRAIGRNIFLDGNSFKNNSPSVDKNHLVADANAGLALSFDDYRLSYSLNYRSKEFKTQDNSSLFGSLTLSTRF